MRAASVASLSEAAPVTMNWPLSKICMVATGFRIRSRSAINFCVKRRYRAKDDNAYTTCLRAILCIVQLKHQLAHTERHGVAVRKDQSTLEHNIAACMDRIRPRGVSPITHTLIAAVCTVARRGRVEGDQQPPWDHPPFGTTETLQKARACPRRPCPGALPQRKCPRAFPTRIRRLARVPPRDWKFHPS